MAFLWYWYIALHIVLKGFHIFTIFESSISNLKKARDNFNSLGFAAAAAQAPGQRATSAEGVAVFSAPGERGRATFLGVRRCQLVLFLLGGRGGSRRY